MLSVKECIILTIKDRLDQLGIELPGSSSSGGSYVPVRILGKFAFISGHTAVFSGERKYLGKVGKDITLVEAKISARDACLNCLASLRNELGSLDRVNSIIKLVGYINSASGFCDQTKVLNGASEVLEKIWGEEGRHARSAVGVAELPANSSVEVEMIVEIND